MLRTYEAILKNERILWTGDAPDQTKPVRIRVTVIDEDETDAKERGRKMAEILSKIAVVDGFSSIEDPEEWQREVRRDRSLPDRQD